MEPATHIKKSIPLTYTLGRSLYIPLTSLSNTSTLPATRGPSFILPSSITSSLLEVRTLEKRQVGVSCSNTGESLSLPPLSPLLPESFRIGKGVGVDRLFDEIKTAMGTSEYEALVFAGEGEPTLRLGAMISLIEKAKLLDSFPSTIRVVTNGLCRSIITPEEKDDSKLCCPLQAMKVAGVTSLSVALMTASAEQYGALMQPHLKKNNNNNNHVLSSSLETHVGAHEAVCSFIADAVVVGLDVEVTAVDRQEVDKEKLKELVGALGVEKPVRWRPYFP